MDRTRSRDSLASGRIDNNSGGVCGVACRVACHSSMAVAVDRGAGSGSPGYYSNNYWQHISAAGEHTGSRLFPL